MSELEEAFTACKGVLATHQQAQTKRVADYLKVLPDLVKAIDEAGGKTFAMSSAQEVARSFAEMDAERVNVSIKSAIDLVREEVTSATAAMGNIAAWVNMQVPACETGNNFGVEVQELVLKRILEVKRELDDMVGKLPDYYKGRAESIARFGKETYEETERNDSQEKTKTQKDASALTEETKDTTRSNNKKFTKVLRNIDDWPAHLVEYDVSWYFKLRTMHASVRSYHLAVCDVVVKNMPKLLDPRNNVTGHGNNDRGGMMMF
mmetsp:Transcript_48737/g.119342  ORF Transcript_48737/g.119342 Transcript_48737/m.119342 type:complete len:263 (+) Transcript_48737:124-912(+)